MHSGEVVGAEKLQERWIGAVVGTAGDERQAGVVFYWRWRLGMRRELPVTIRPVRPIRLATTAPGTPPLT